MAGGKKNMVTAGSKKHMRASETEPIQFDYNRHAFTVGAKVSHIDLSAAVWFLMGRRLVSAPIGVRGGFCGFGGFRQRSHRF